jgi:hypothetical protein
MVLSIDDEYNKTYRMKLTTPFEVQDANENRQLVFVWNGELLEPSKEVISIPRRIPSAMPPKIVPPKEQIRYGTSLSQYYDSLSPKDKIKLGRFKTLAGRISDQLIKGIEDNDRVIIEDALTGLVMACDLVPMEVNGKACQIYRLALQDAIPTMPIDPDTKELIEDALSRIKTGIELRTEHKKEYVPSDELDSFISLFNQRLLDILGGSIGKEREIGYAKHKLNMMMNYAGFNDIKKVFIDEFRGYAPTVVERLKYVATSIELNWEKDIRVVATMMYYIILTKLDTYIKYKYEGDKAIRDLLDLRKHIEEADDIIKDTFGSYSPQSVLGD